MSFSQALLHFTEKLIVIAALLPGPWTPAVAAKQIASIDNYTKGRIAVNIVSGWFKVWLQRIDSSWVRADIVSLNLHPLASGGWIMLRDTVEAGSSLRV